jgi:hypothetical protein
LKRIRVKRLGLLTATAFLMASAIVGVFGAQVASAYRLYGVKWCQGWADISFMSSWGSQSFNLDRASVQGAASAWSQVGAGTMGGKVKFQYYWATDNNRQAKIQLFAAYSTVNGTLAYTSFGYNPFSGCINDGTSIQWNTAYGFNPSNSTCDGSTSWYSMYAVSEHELGHALGLDHSGDIYAQMYYQTPVCQWKYLNGDDEAGAIAIYGQQP